MSLTWEQVRAWRVARHELHARAPAGGMLDVVSRLCGVHAQLMSSAELTLWARVEDLHPDAVARALWEERTLVKQWAMRGTLHLLPAAELGLWHAGLGTYRHYLKPYWFRGFGLTPEQFEAMLAAIAEVLDGQLLTREELAAAVEARSGDAALGEKMRESWGSMLKPAAFRGLLCFGPGEGQKVRFTRPESWLGAPIPRPDPDEALREIARRYLAVHGPAGREDLRRWWAVTPAAAGKLLRSLGDAVEVEVEGEPLWLLERDVDALSSAGEPAGVRLLPAFDQYVVAATLQAERFMPGPFRDRIYRPQGWLSPVLLVDGRMEGVWRHERKGRRVEISIEPFVAVGTAVRRAAEEEAERLAAFLGGEPAISWAA